MSFEHCHGCKPPTRHVGCHSDCPYYQADIAKYNEAKEEEARQTQECGAYEKGENRFERMEHTHPKHYEFCIGGGAYDPADGMWKPNEKGLGYGRVLDYIGVRY